MSDFRNNEIQLVTAGDRETINEICRFRVRVWLATAGVAPTAFPTKTWRDRVDDVAQHWICRDAAGRLLACGRLAMHASIREMIEPHEYERFGLQVSGSIAAPDRVVVLPAAQGQGLAGRLLDKQHAASKAAGAVCALRQASPKMARLLVRRGWKLYGPASTDWRFPGIQFTVAGYTFDPERVTVQPGKEIRVA
jgi:GNAT superfamily N-acetyltransferase